MTKTFPCKILKRKTMLNAVGQVVTAPVLGAILESDGMISSIVSQSMEVCTHAVDRETPMATTGNEATMNRCDNDERSARSFIMFGEMDVDELTRKTGNEGTKDSLGELAIGGALENPPGSDVVSPPTDQGTTPVTTHAQPIGIVPPNIDCEQSLTELRNNCTEPNNLDSELLNLSQASFVREILEIHDRIISSSPIPEVGTPVVVLDKANGPQVQSRETLPTKATPVLNAIQAQHQSLVVEHTVDPAVRVDEATKSEATHVATKKQRKETPEKTEEATGAKSAKCGCKVTMATQTEPNKIIDPLVMRSEFESHLQYVERSITDHERRLRSTEIWREKNDRKVDKIDADYYNQINELRAQQETMNKNHADLIQRLESEREKLIESNTCSKIIECSSTEISVEDTPPSKPDRKRKRVVSGNKTINGKKLGKKSPLRDKHTMSRKKDSVYQSLMKAARDVLSPRVRIREPIIKQKVRDIPSDPDKTRPSNRDSTPLLRSKGRSGEVGRDDNQQEEKRESVITASTPIPGQRHENPSWADEDEDDRTIDAYLATLEKEEVSEQPKRRNVVRDHQIPGPSGVNPEANTRKSNPTTRTGPSAHTLRRPMTSTDNTADKPTSQQQTTRRIAERTQEVSKYGGARPKQKPVGYKSSERETNGRVVTKPNVNFKEADNKGGDSQNRYAPLANKEGTALCDNASSKKDKPGASKFYVNDTTKTNLDGSVSMIKDVPGNQGTEFMHQDAGDESQSDDDDGQNEENKSGNSSYAEVATKSKWLTQGSGKKAKNRPSPKSLLKTFPPIKGSRVRQHRDIFIRGVVKTEFNSPEDLESALQAYCEERGVGTVFVKVLVDKYESNTARCRICVFEVDWMTVMDPTFWPEDVEVREWFVNPKDKKNANNNKHDG